MICSQRIGEKSTFGNKSLF